MKSKLNFLFAFEAGAIFMFFILFTVLTLQFKLYKYVSVYLLGFSALCLILMEVFYTVAYFKSEEKTK